MTLSHASMFPTQSAQSMGRLRSVSRIAPKTEPRTARSARGGCRDAAIPLPHASGPSSWSVVSTAGGAPLGSLRSDILDSRASMHASVPLAKPRPAPDAIQKLALRLEERGIAVWRHGNGLLSALGSVGTAGQSLLCTADASTLLALLPTAVVTASQARRLSLPTPDGPVDLLPIGDCPLEHVLIGFGLGALGFAWREAGDPETGERWCDPVGARLDFLNGCMGPTTAEPNPFLLLPDRIWVAARLLAEYQLRATPELLAQAREALAAGGSGTARTEARTGATFPPLGAPARHELARVLRAPRPAYGLAFLAESGVSPRLFPGLERSGETLVGELPRLPALRWAAWLRGCKLQQALVGLRMPPALGRSIARLQAAHPLDRTLDPKPGSRRDAGLRKLLQRLTPEEVDGLVLWRRRDLETRTSAAADLEALDRIRQRIEQLREEHSRAVQMRRLALDGEAVMQLLDAGPGPHVGQALAHLARFVLAHPEANARAPLEEELRRWAAESASKEAASKR